MVTLNPAYSWDCPDCGAENFERGIVPEMSDEDLETARMELGVEASDEGVVMLMPEEVQCKQCNAIFTTTHYKDA